MKRPGSLGRIVRHHGAIRAIVEVADASQDTLKIREVNTGIYVTTAELLKHYLPRIQSHNAQGEFYLTELISLALEQEEKVTAISAPPGSGLWGQLSEGAGAGHSVGFSQKGARAARCRGDSVGPEKHLH